MPSVHSQHTNTQTVTPSTRHSHLAHITPASFKCSQTCDAYRAHRHGSESPYPGSTPGLNPCNHLARQACGPWPFTGKVFISTPRTPDRRTHRCKFNTARGPQDPLTTAVLDQPPGRAARRLAPPGRLKRDLNKAHLHLGDLLPDPLRVAHLRRSCELFTPCARDLGSEKKTLLVNSRPPSRNL